MRRTRSAKIVATLGPATTDEPAIRALFERGVDVFRLNFSHGTQHDHARRLDTIRRLEKEFGRPIGVLLDLQGPKLRLGTFEGGRAQLDAGSRFRLDMDKASGNARRAPLLHPEIFAALQVGTELLLDDGKLRLRVDSYGADFAETTVLVGGPISDRKGVNVPSVLLPISPLTPKDLDDLACGLAMGVDWVALSFVQRPDDLAEVRKIARGRVGLMSKIEKPQALERIEEIIELSDALMVARGDLGVEMPLESVPGIQKQLIRACRRSGKPVVVATQMLESMISAPVPTRAEVSDVATAVFEGADAVMLSAESASGDYPVEAVATMASIATAIEREPHYPGIIYAQRAQPEATGADAISLAARQIAETLKLSAIVCYTSSGTTGLRASRERPQVPILALSPIIKTARRLAVVWGLHCVVTHDATDLDDMVNRACRIVADEGFGKPGDRIIISAGVPLGTPGATNMIRIAYIGSDGQSGV